MRRKKKYCAGAFRLWKERDKMRILRLHIENFGKLHDFDMDFQEGFHRVCTENGWGKSTLAAFIRAMFYGLPVTARRSLKENDRKHYVPWQGGAFGGSMEFQAGEKTYRAERFFGKKDREDTFVLYDLETGLLCSDYSGLLGEELFHVDRAAYVRSSFFLQQDFAVALNDSLNARLTHVEEDAGDMGNYEQAMLFLENQMKYYRKTGNRGQIGKLEEQRRSVREELLKCREQEEEAEEWRFRLISQRQRIEEAADHVEKLEKRLRHAQDCQQIEKKRAQYALLKSQAEEKQEELQKMAVELSEYTSAPPKEKELDKAREWICQLEVFRQKESEAKRQVQDAVSRLGNMEDARDAHVSPGMLYGIPAGICLIPGIFCLLRDLLAAGLVFLGTGILFFSAGFMKVRKSRMEKEHLEKRIQVSRQQVREAERVLRETEKKQENLEKKICEFLSLPKHTDPAQMERSWKQMRRKSREYRDLKQRYELQRKEVSRSRELWFQYGEGFSEEEHRLLSASGKEGYDLRTWKDRLEECRIQLRHLQKEENDIQYRIAGLQERAERLPELEERESWLSEKTEEAVREYALLEQTAGYLKLARERFSARYLSDLQDRLEYYMGILKPEQESSLSLDVALHLKVQEAGALRPMEYQSAGQQDLFHFAERLAILDVLYKEEQPPLILDDPFVNLDTAKQQRAVDILKQLSEKRQVIYFTCHNVIGEKAV